MKKALLLGLSVMMVSGVAEQAAQQNLSTREVPEGTVLNQSQSTVIGPDGQVIQQSSDSAVTPSPMPATQTQPGAPVEDLTRSVQ